MLFSTQAETGHGALAIPPSFSLTDDEDQLRHRRFISPGVFWAVNPLQYLKKKNQKPLYEALQKVKEGTIVSLCKFIFFFVFLNKTPPPPPHHPLNFLWCGIVYTYIWVHRIRYDFFITIGLWF